MSRPPIDIEVLQATVDAYSSFDNNQTLAAEALGISRGGLQHRLKQAAARGLLGTAPVLPGFEITQTTAVTNADGDIVREFIQQKPERVVPYERPADHTITGISALVGGDGNIINQWIKTSKDLVVQHNAMSLVLEAMKSEIPREDAILMPPRREMRQDLLNQYTITDAHFGKLSWGEETGSDYDLKIAEQMYLDWFSMALAQSPKAATGLLAQLGDMLHYDSQRSVTPTHGHVLDSDTRLQKMVRVVIRVLRQMGRMMLGKYERVHWIMADANHDEAGEAWLREMFAALFDNEPRLTVDRSPSSYYAYEFGLVSLFYHHGHKRKPSQADSVFAGRFREIYGRTKFSYAHLGHRHSDELLTTNLMKVEQHETLAAPDAHEANGGWPLGRSAKVITYSSRFGEVGRSTITPEMILAEAA